jgi:hypothetical protein
MPLPLLRAGSEIRTVFDLLGTAENDLTAAYGWALSQVPALARALLADVYGTDVGDATSVSLQMFGVDKGFTDIEVNAENAHLIIEAKVGWVVPQLSQLERYAPRVESLPGPLILSVSGCTAEFAALRLPQSVMGVPVRHRSWTQLAALAEHVASDGSHASRRLLRELAIYLRGATTMQNKASNWTYCVSLGATSYTDWGITFFEVVQERHKYFHPYASGGNWPRTAPNFLAFRWNGAVRHAHHVESFQIVGDLHEVFDEIPEGHGMHVVYDLGPDIMQGRVLASGGNYRANRNWVYLDLLLTSPTLKEALTARTIRRLSIEAST